MKSVFQVGDVVYEAKHGKGVIVRVEPNYSLQYLIVFECDWTGWSEEVLLSFSPWLSPNHERPLKDGRYIRRISGGYDMVLYRYKGEWYYIKNGVVEDRYTPEGGEGFIYIGE